MTPDSVKASYRQAIVAAATTVVVRRYTGTGENAPFFDVSVGARVVGYEPHELLGLIQQGDRRVIMLAEDLSDAQFPLPLRKGDKVLVRGRELNIEAVDDNTRRVQGVLVAYELQVRG